MGLRECTLGLLLPMLCRCTRSEHLWLAAILPRYTFVFEVLTIMRLDCGGVATQSSLIL